MTFEALLTFIGILVAALAIVRPVQRRSLMLFVPIWRLPVAILIAFVLLVLRDAPLGINPPFRWPLPVVLFVLTLSAFLIPVLVALWCWASWHLATITPNRARHVEDIFQAALREHEFDEVERILRRNIDTLTSVPADAAAVLFSPAMVSALVDSHSLIHLDLLANLQFLKSLNDRYAAVDAVVRELLVSQPSPIRSAVVSQYGGLEHFAYSDKERELIQATFQNPEWYFEAGAHYPLVIAAIEELRNGKRDTDYNSVGRDYEASQGISRRAYCPIYLAIKTEVLAIEAAVKHHSEQDFYVSDLLDIFRAVQERSVYSKAIWESPLANNEYPTPYAYLLYQIAMDLRDLSSEAVYAAVSRSTPVHANAPGRIARDLAMIWSFCVWSIADSKDQVSSEFRDDIIREYLLFMLGLGWEPSEVHPGISPPAGGLGVWRDLFLDELAQRFAADSHREAVLKGAFQTLDQGKRFVFEGSEWLEGELFGSV